MNRNIDLGRPIVRIEPGGSRRDEDQGRFPTARIEFPKAKIYTIVSFHLSQDILFECYGLADRQFLMRYSFSFGDWFQRECLRILDPEKQEDMSLDFFEIDTISDLRTQDCTGFRISIPNHPDGQRPSITVDIRDRETVLSGSIAGVPMKRCIIPYDRVFRRVLS